MTQRQPDIILVGIDTLRPDHLGCYGYDLPTSPHMDQLAEHGIVFDTAIAAGIPTTPSFTTLLSGAHPYRHRIVTHPARRRLPKDVVLLPELAQRAGYTTVACDNMVVQGSGRASWFTRGYHEYSGFSYTPFGDQSTQLTDRALSFLSEERDNPMFLFIHYWDPHTPYGPRAPYDTMHYRPGRGGVDMADVRALAPEYYESFLADMRLRYPDDYAYVVAQYDGEITQVDRQVGRLMRGLKDLGRWDNTVIAVVSDHGECFGEGDFYFDHHGLYDAVTQIAFLLRLPGEQPRRIPALVSHEDIVPTLAELADFERVDDLWTGHSLAPLLSGSSTSVRSRVISTESTRQASLALRTETKKLIMPVVEDSSGEEIPDFYGRSRSPKPQLFDLEDCSAERRDIGDEHPEVVADMRAELERWCAAMNQTTGEADPIRSQGLGLPYEAFIERVRTRTQ